MKAIVKFKLNFISECYINNTYEPNHFRFLFKTET